MRSATPIHPHDLSDSDLALITALQQAPRASWARIGRAIGVSAPTARRRWETLAAAGAAWSSAYAVTAPGLVTGLVEIRCRPGTVDEVAAQLRTEPKFLSLTGMTGERDLVVTIVADDMEQFRRLIQSRVATHEAVTGVRSTIVTRMFSEGSRWRAVGSPETAGVGDDSDAARPDDDAPSLAAQWRPVLRALEADGRVAPADIARELGVSEAHARRVVRRVLERGWIKQRIDVSLEQTMWPHALALWLVVPAGRLEATASEIAVMPMTRMCAALAGGASNLYVIVWLRDLAEATAVEAELARSLELRVLDRAILLHYYKRVGHLFDERNRYEGRVSWVGDGTG